MGYVSRARNIHRIYLNLCLCARKGNNTKHLSTVCKNPTGARINKHMCVIAHAEILKSRRWGGRCSDLGAPLGRMIKKAPWRLRGRERHKQSYAAINTHQASFSVNAALMGRWCRKTPLYIFLVSSVFTETAFASKLGKKDPCLFSPSPPLPLVSLCPVVGWLLRSRCVWMAVITGTQVPLAHGV